MPGDGFGQRSYDIVGGRGIVGPYDGARASEEGAVIPVIAYSSLTPPTLITSLAAQHLTEWTKTRGWEPVELPGFGANKLRFSRTMRWVKSVTAPPHAVFYLVHGFPASLMGSDF